MLRQILLSIVLFLLAGLAEIGGGYLIWIWFRNDAHYIWGALGALVLILYGIIPTFQQFPSFGRIYAAYGGVFIIMAILWGWMIDGVTPDFYDWLGTSIALIGSSIILWAPRQRCEEKANKVGELD